jgi:hypothetical protein
MVNTAASARKGHDQSNTQPRESSWSPNGDPSPAGPVRAGGRIRPPPARHPGEEDSMLVEHGPQPGRSDLGHGHGCAPDSDLVGAASVRAMDLTIYQSFLPHEDPEASLGFWRDTLGFEVRDDVGYQGMRWITLGPADQPEASLSIEVST